MDPDTGNPLEALGRHFAPGPVTWTIATGLFATPQGPVDMVVLIFETQAGTMAVPLARADAEKFSATLRTTMAGIIVAGNGGGPV